jgi:undecaprenyl-diphosphatase
VSDDPLKLFGLLNMSKWPALSSGTALKGRGRRTALLVLLSLASIGLLSFAFLVSEASRGVKLGFDDLLLVALRADDLSKPIGPSWVASMFRDITSLGSPTVVTVVTSLALAYFLLSHRLPEAVLVLFSVVGAALINTSVKEIVGRLRPDVVSHLVEVHTLSFPSGHSTLSAATYLTLGAIIANRQELQRVRIFVLMVGAAVPLLVGCSRVYLGVHWPTDVLAGWSLGLAWAALCVAAYLVTWSDRIFAERRAFPQATK